MNDDTTLLLGLDGLTAQRVERDSDGQVRVYLVTADRDAARCPSCATVATGTKQQVSTRPRDLAYGGQQVSLV